MQTVQEFPSIDAETFRDRILPVGQPVIFRGLVRRWPVVEAATRSSEALFQYLRRFDRGASVSTMFAPPSANGRFFYNDDLTGFNFQQGTAKIESALSFLSTHADDPEASALAVQSVPVRANLPGFQEDNPLSLLDPSIEARVWLGNRVVVAAHHDPSENIACCVAGRRRFTLFPPKQVANLYMGPFELTPAGATISMVDFDKPDLDRYPRFLQALEASLVADLEPGDALYIPYHWWHHVRSIEAVNMLVNYWWTPPQLGGQPRDAFLLSLLAIKGLPPSHRAAWRALFDHYVFADEDDPAEHLPAARRGILGDVTPDEVRSLRTALSRTLSRSV